jgi:hypothetical protein
MNTQIQQDKKSDSTKAVAEHQKAIIQNKAAAPHENAPAFTKIEPAATKPVPRETAQEAVHQVIPKTEANKLDADVTAETVAKKSSVKDPIPKDTAAHGDDDLMSKKVKS